MSIAKAAAKAGTKRPGAPAGAAAKRGKRSLVRAPLWALVHHWGCKTVKLFFGFKELGRLSELLGKYLLGRAHCCAR